MWCIGIPDVKEENEKWIKDYITSGNIEVMRSSILCDISSTNHEQRHNTGYIVPVCVCFNSIILLLHN